MPKGFTLIELLVAMTILAILAVLGLVSYTSVQKNGRDAIRREHVQLIAQAIEAKKSSTGTYTFTASSDQNNTTADLSLEFPDPSLKATAKIGLDPSNVNYCIYTSTTTTTPQTPQGATSLDPWNGSQTSAACRSGIIADNEWVPVSLGITGAKSWTICARLESVAGTSFCRQSLSR